MLCDCHFGPHLGPQLLQLFCEPLSSCRTAQTLQGGRGQWPPRRSPESKVARLAPRLDGPAAAPSVPGLPLRAPTEDQPEDSRLHSRGTSGLNEAHQISCRLGRGRPAMPDVSRHEQITQCPPRKLLVGVLRRVTLLVVIRASTASAPSVSLCLDTLQHSRTSFSNLYLGVAALQLMQTACNDETAEPCHRNSSMTLLVPSLAVRGQLATKQL